VATAEIEKDPRVGLSKGSAYVTFKKSKDMNQAMLHLDGAQLDGNVIKATFVLVANKRRREPSLGNLLWKCSCTLNF
jgi:RNA-binding protein with serine-rich domain 1